MGNVYYGHGRWGHQTTAQAGLERGQKLNLDRLVTWIKSVDGGPWWRRREWRKGLGYTGDRQTQTLELMAALAGAAVSQGNNLLTAPNATFYGRGITDDFSKRLKKFTQISKPSGALSASVKL